MKIYDVHKHFKKRYKINSNYIKLKLAHTNPPGKAKNWWLRRMGIDMGKNVFVSPGVVFDPIFPELIHIGDNVFFGWNARVFTHIITPFTDKAFRKMILMQDEGKLRTIEIVVSDGGKYSYILAAGDIWIEEGVFIGGFTTVRPGVKIGAGAVIGSDSLVTGDIPRNKIAFGKPAKIRGDRLDD